MTTLDQIRGFLLSLFPPGFENLYDLTPGVGDLYQLMDAFAQAFKSYVFDSINTLRTEIFPQSAVQKLPDWETALGISNQAPAIFGNTAQRQQAVIAKLREFGPFCDQVVQSVIGPLFGYFPSTPVQIIKCIRSELDTAHTYTGGGFSVPNGTTVSSAPVTNHDGGTTSKAGARVTITLDSPLPANATFQLIAPDGTTVNLSTPHGSTTYHCFAAGVAGTPVSYGSWWVLKCHNTSGSTVSIDSWSLIVEGINRNQETGGAIFVWGVYADPLHVSENTPADYVSARAAIDRIEHSHTRGEVILALSAKPDSAQAIPDTFLPV